MRYMSRSIPAPAGGDWPGHTLPTPKQPANGSSLPAPRGHLPAACSAANLVSDNAKHSDTSNAALQKLTDQGLDLTQRRRSVGGGDIHESRAPRCHDALIVLPAAKRGREGPSLVSHPGHAAERDREPGAELRDVRRTNVPEQLDDHIQGPTPVLAGHARRTRRQRRSSSALDDGGGREGDAQGRPDCGGGGTFPAPPQCSSVARRWPMGWWRPPGGWCPNRRTQSLPSRRETPSAPGAASCRVTCAMLYPRARLMRYRTASAALRALDRTICVGELCRL
jgi:hypothetical protein